MSCSSSAWAASWTGWNGTWPPPEDQANPSKPARAANPSDTSFRGGHARPVENQPERRNTRRHEIGDRIAAIRTRIDDLQQARESRLTAESSERLTEAQNHAARSRAMAQRALASSIQGLLRAAQAHDRSASSHERLANAVGSDKEEHRQQVAHHRAAAAADRRRAQAAQELLSSRVMNRPEDEQRGDRTAS
jgi:hypothetical protein